MLLILIKCLFIVFGQILIPEVKLIVFNYNSYLPLYLHHSSLLFLFLPFSPFYLTSSRFICLSLVLSHSLILFVNLSFPVLFLCVRPPVLSVPFSLCLHVTPSAFYLRVIYLLQKTFKLTTYH